MGRAMPFVEHGRELAVSVKLHRAHGALLQGFLATEELQWA